MCVCAFKKELERNGSLKSLKVHLPKYLQAVICFVVCTGSVYNEDFSLNVAARPYTSDSSEMKNNHPLMIMVGEGQKN